MQVSFSLPIQTDSDGAPPSEFRIWKWGENDTLRGSVVLDKKSAADVMAAYSEHGVELAIDYEHQTLNAETNGKPAPAAGWFKPEVREDGLYATGVHWTDEASGYLKSRQYRYFSPVALLDAKSRKPTKLLPMALTNWPATKNIASLVARADELNTESNMSTVLLALGLKADADDAEAFAAANKLREFERGILSFTGKDSPADAMGVLTALRMKAEQGDAAVAELATLKASAIAGEKKALIDAAIVGGVPAAKRAELEALELSALKVCLSILPKAPAVVVEKKPEEGGADASGLTPEVLKVLKATGVKPEDFAKHRKVLASITNPSEEQ